MIQFSYIYLSFHLVGGEQPSFPLLYCCVMLFVLEGTCAQSAFVSLLLPVRVALVFREVILFSVPPTPPVPPPASWHSVRSWSFVYCRETP